MAKEPTERKPEGKGGAGKEKEEAAGAEVAGRGKEMLYICFNDGSASYVGPDWKWFTCWRCGQLVILKE
jgi:hypothetical protein